VLGAIPDYEGENATDNHVENALKTLTPRETEVLNLVAQEFK